MSRPRIVLLAHLLLFALWAVYLLSAHKGGREIWLETAPVDPRDILSGHYVALDYDVSRLENINCPKDEELSGPVYVLLVQSSDVVSTDEGVVNPWRAVRCSARAPQNGNHEVWMRGRIADIGWRRRMEYGIERFYVPEDSPLRNVVSGQVVAKVSINQENAARILNLVRIRNR